MYPISETRYHYIPDRSAVISSAPKCTLLCTSMICFSWSALHFTLKCIALSLEVPYASPAVYCTSYEIFCHSTLYSHLVNTSHYSVVYTAPTQQCGSVLVFICIVLNLPTPFWGLLEPQRDVKVNFTNTVSKQTSNFSDIPKQQSETTINQKNTLFAPGLMMYTR